jgi:hypothetical protein
LNFFYGLKLLPGDAEMIHACTQRDPAKAPPGGFQTAVFLTGRRSGKSRTAALVAAYEAALAGHERQLSSGERGLVVVCSPTRRQSVVVKDYIRAVFEAPLLAAELKAEQAEGFELQNGIRIEILTGDFRSVRGFTAVACILDEAAFLGLDDQARVKSDGELIRALEPMLATTNGKLIVISSPHARKGWCFSQYQKHFGNDAAATLVWNAASRTMNPTLSEAYVNAKLAEDPVGARSEYLGEFRDDVSGYVPRELVESLVVKGRTVLPPEGKRYAGFVDISGGMGDDDALCVGHLEGRTVIVDCLERYRPPFSPVLVIQQHLVPTLRRYGCDRVLGDNYGSRFCKDAFEECGIHYSKAVTNAWKSGAAALHKVEKTKAQLYLELLPRLQSREIELLDDPVLVEQLASLERRTRAGGRDLVDHVRDGHDDLANVVAGVCDAVLQRPVVAGAITGDGVRGNESRFDRAREDLAARQRSHEAQRDYLNRAADASGYRGLDNLRSALGKLGGRR